jgi:cytochrome oxidase Cu insertion factor (SCO1/SenC/PrrC family)
MAVHYPDMSATFARAGFVALALAALVWEGGAVTASSTPTQAPAPDVRALGPQVGEQVPDFSLVDQHGRTRTLASLMGPNGLVLVFSRSADW